MKQRFTMKRLEGFLGWSIAALMLVVSTATGSENIRIVTDPLNWAGTLGVEQFELPVIAVAILGTPDFDPSTVLREGLRFGPRNREKAEVLWFARTEEDVNDDGYSDRVAFFRLSESRFDEYRQGFNTWVALTGAYLREGPAGVVDTFEANGQVGSGACNPVSISSDVEGVRCHYYESTVTANWGDLVANVQQIASDNNRVIDDSSAVLFEANGSDGRDGNGAVHQTESCSGGIGGSGGYALSIQTVADVTNYLSALGTSNLHIYAAPFPSVNASGGPSSIVMGRALNTVVEDDTPRQAGIIASSGGGGGGSSACSFEKGLETVCRSGSAGGTARTVNPNLDADVSEPGQSGVGSNPGMGGGNGVGGEMTSTQFPDGYGANGIGGQGSSKNSCAANHTCPGPGATPYAGNPFPGFTAGLGGWESNDGGAGGAGWGGGAAGQGCDSSHHSSGGGSGGSFGLQSTVPLSSVGHLTTNRSRGVVNITFQTSLR